MAAYLDSQTNTYLLVEHDTNRIVYSNISLGHLNTLMDMVKCQKTGMKYQEVYPLPSKIKPMGLFVRGEL